jgi:hypothetical protein
VGKQGCDSLGRHEQIGKGCQLFKRKDWNMNLAIFDGRALLLIAIIAGTWAWYWLGNE